MLKKIAVIGGIVAVAALGFGGAAWAQSSSAAPQAVAATSAQSASTTTAAAPSTAGRAAKVKAAAGKRDALARRLEKVSHAQWVNKDGKTGAFVTHDAVRGLVSAVNSGSITIKAADGTSETFAINSGTKVHVRGNAKGTAGTIAQVKVGDAAGVLGTGAGLKTATQVIDRGVPKATVPKATVPPTTS